MPVRKKIRYAYFGVFFLFSSLIPFSFANAMTIIKVPYTMQAPESNWKQPWQDACEEASTIMLDYYYTGKKMQKIPVSQAKQAIMKVVNLENKSLGFNRDTNASQIIDIINNYYTWEAFIVNYPTIDQIKAEIDNQRPVILPVHGKTLKNPYFKNGGPVYHVLVVKGYDDDRQEFITNEPGNSKGLDYRYKYATLMAAIHDFLPNNKTEQGNKVAIFTSPDIYSSKSTDGDKDGLTKIDELKYGTSLTSNDTDSDGFIDGDEVDNGYIPTIAEANIPSGKIVKSDDSPNVYLIDQIFDQKYKRLIANEAAFYNNGLEWKDIILVSPKYISELKDAMKIE